jgi:tRNA (cytidine/uridine-2'-O-)-methyltransferase
MHIALFQPEIPQNTGTIGRLCVATNTPLYLIRPLGFHLDDKAIRRSGLDYWEHLNYECLDSLEDLQTRHPDSRIWFFSTKGKQPYTGVTYDTNDILVFGSEGSGFTDKIYTSQKTSLVNIPQWGPVRSLNLATAVGIVLYEAYRQLGFD